MPGTPLEVRVWPALKPALRRVWRDRHTLQVGLDPATATMFTDVEPPVAAVLSGLVGDQSVDAVARGALAEGVDEATTRDLLRLLTDAGLLDDAVAAAAATRGLPPAERDRLAPDQHAISLAGRARDGGAAVLLRRRSAAVAVYGCGRVGASAASLLGAAGVGLVTATDPVPATPADAAPAGLAARDVGLPRQAGALRAVAQAAPSTKVDAPAGRRPDAVLLAPDEQVDRDLAATLVRHGVPHLVARVEETTAIIGPLVVPGRTSCLRCHDLVRTDRDPTWPTVLTQLAAAPAGVRACDVALATAAAAVAALHLLGFLSGVDPPSVDGVVELRWPWATPRRRSFAPHPACGCQWEHLGPDAATP